MPGLTVRSSCCARVSGVTKSFPERSSEGAMARVGSWPSASKGRRHSKPTASKPATAALMLHLGLVTAVVLWQAQEAGGVRGSWLPDAGGICGNWLQPSGELGVLHGDMVDGCTET